jgi:hypothetical protein
VWASQTAAGVVKQVEVRCGSNWRGRAYEFGSFE